ncbi:MAG: FlgO family outer membrane protein [Desulfobacteraceae bacterium]|nr:FlgO family outer membrane protein [Desulfobacteraceae bacterium]
MNKTQTPVPPWRRRLLPRPARSRAAICGLACFTVLYCSAAGRGEPQAPAEPQAAQAAALADQGEAARFEASIRQMAGALFAHLGGDADPNQGDLADGIVVSSFVDLRQLTRTSSFGRYLAEQLMGEFQQRGYRVVEIRKSKDILIQERRGEYGLSRNPGEIKPEVAAQALVTGTYTVTEDSILVNAKVLDNRSAVLLSSATMVFPRTKLANLLLADSASARPPRARQEMTTMKRLE